MPVYHSQFNKGDYPTHGNMAVLPIKTAKNYMSDANPDDEDIIDETLNLFRVNCLFRNFEIKGNADRVLIYLILFVSQCLDKLNKNMSQSEAQWALNNLASSNFAMPGDPKFPLNAMYTAPTDRNQREQLRLYLQQLRQELAERLVKRVFADGTASKWWLCFKKRKFMNLSL